MGKLTRMKLLTPAHWKAYELLDSGDGEKLERFGAVVLARPEPQAVWSKHFDEAYWQKHTHARFIQKGSHSGQWERYKSMKDQWFVDYRYKGMKLTFRLGLTQFKHVGIFPEQATNWEFIYDSTQHIPQARVLNLFAYTGGASLAARSAGAQVVHCDSVKSVLNWAHVNMEASGLSDIRWLLEDAFKFVRREEKRGNVYQGIILDPPAYGHGPKGEKWKLEDMVSDLVASVSSILDPKQNFLVMNTYSLGYSSLILQNLLFSHFLPKQLKQLECGELYLEEKSGRKLPMGIFGRFWNGLDS